jgi:hypothetical protein
MSGVVSGMVNSPMYGTILTALVGQCSEHEPHDVPSVTTMQLCLSNLTTPICVVSFSSTVKGKIAPLGHISVQRTHSWLQTLAF